MGFLQILKELIFVQASLWVVEGLVDGHPFKKLNQHKIDFTKVYNMPTQEVKNMDDYVSLHKRFYQNHNGQRKNGVFQKLFDLQF